MKIILPKNLQNAFLMVVNNVETIKVSYSKQFVRDLTDLAKRSPMC